MSTHKPVRSTTLDEIGHLLVAARTERSGDRCRLLLEEAIRLCDGWERSEGMLEAVILKAQTIGELALEEMSPEARATRWKESLNTLASRWGPETSAALAEAYAGLSVDCFQDALSSFNEGDRTRILRNARDYLNRALSREKNPEVAAALLSRKSSVLRHMSTSVFAAQVRKNLLGESSRCAARAVDQLRAAATILERGLSEWALARIEATDEQYVLRLRKAEAYLADELLAKFEPAQLTLPRFYRLTFRPLDACLTFSRELHRVENMRRLLRNSYVYGESAVQLWYADYPESVAKHHLSEAKTLLETAIAAGYHNARVIISLAFLLAILDGPSAGKTALTEIYTSEKEISWNDVCRILVERTSVTGSPPSELVTEGLALGINQSAVWTRLGTFALEFLGDEDLGEALYKAAVRLSPHDAIAHTNYARFLVRKGDSHSLQKAERELQKAQNFADRRFTWWRAVLADLRKKGAEHAPASEAPAQGLKKPHEPPSSFQNMDQIKHRFQMARKLSDAQQRGYQLEQLVFEVAKLTFGTAAPPYRLVRARGAISQIDGYFEHRGEKYRVECKWEARPSDHNRIILFSDKLEVAGVSGLFISMAGFTSSAIQRAKELRSEKVILLMDGGEAEAIFSGRLIFDELMTRKRLRFDQFSEPYYHTAPVPELA